VLPVLLFPGFDPVMVRIGPFAIRWYALAYILGLLIGWRLLRRLAAAPPLVASPLLVDDFLSWATLGVVIGGRLGYVLFYQPHYYFAHPLMIFALWRGGMSFHGGMLGVAAAITLFARAHRLALLGFADRIAVCAPIGLGLGRIANFINGELWGRPAPPSLPWAMIFPAAGPIPRHPSEIYEALLEGVLLFLLMVLLYRREGLRARFGFLTGAFLAGYALARSTAEFFREPDAFLGFLPGGLTMGQVLSLPMLLAGIALMAWAARRPPRPLQAGTASPLARDASSR
jgi:phosphatidylglycerol:prolipoprotein diacylglycerol transferase